MRFALCAADRHRGVLEAFINAGWTPIKLFSTPTDERIDATLLGFFVEQHREGLERVSHCAVTGRVDLARIADDIAGVFALDLRDAMRNVTDDIEARDTERLERADGE